MQSKYSIVNKRIQISQRSVTTIRIAHAKIVFHKIGNIAENTSIELEPQNDAI